MAQLKRKQPPRSQLNLTLKPWVLDAIRSAASRAGERPSTWARWVLVQAAQRSQEVAGQASGARA
jgi:hypothetical protein